MQLFVNLNSGKGGTQTRTLLLHYGSACVLVALALLATLALPEIRNGTPFLFFFPAVIFSAIIGPGLLALALAGGRRSWPPDRRRLPNGHGGHPLAAG